MGHSSLLLFQQRPTNMKVVARLALFCLVAVSAKSSGLAVEKVLKQDESTTAAPTTTAAPATTTAAPATSTAGPATTTGAVEETTTAGTPAVNLAASLVLLVPVVKYLL